MTIVSWAKNKDTITKVIDRVGSTIAFTTATYTKAFDGSVAGQTNASHSETILVKAPQQADGLKREGLLPDDTLNFWARYDSSISVDATFTWDSKKYVVISLDQSLVAGITMFYNGTARRSKERE